MVSVDGVSGQMASSPVCESSTDFVQSEAGRCERVEENLQAYSLGMDTSAGMGVLG